MSHRSILGFALLSALLVPVLLSAQHKGSQFDSLAIEVRADSREFVFTNKQTAHYYGETGALASSGWMGFTVFGHQFINDYQLLVNGEPLDRSTALVTRVYPDYLERKYPGGITEQLHIVDSLALFALIVTSDNPVELGVMPLLADTRSPSTLDLRLSEATASLARTTHVKRTDAEDYPVWLSISGKGFLPEKKNGQRGFLYAPFMLYARRSRTHIVAVAVADERDAAERLAQGYAANAASYSSKRRTRMERLLDQSAVRTGDARFDKALAWAKLSLDALIMNQRTPGIFAGLPWFNSYWGRDTFISLPGATLVTGRYSEAKRILRSFAAFQMTDSSSTDYGRIPNIVTTSSRGYNTADGTPRFVMMVREYIERSGDERFLLELYPTVLRSIEGTIRYHTDASGFLTHGDAETWMDAVGPEGPWSPRGNRANDVQALWAQHLEAGVWCATRVGDVTSARSWHTRFEHLVDAFRQSFIRNGTVVDHVRANGTPDSTLRPNQVFTGLLLDDSTRARMIRTVTNTLTYPYGVASLAQTDPEFHPYHQYPPFYPKDAAYHNGTVWTWLQGPLISELAGATKQDFAFRLTESAVHQILDRGAVGTQSELLDAIPRPGEREPNLSGTCSQAWNLAEFVRNFYDDYLGARVDLLTHTMTLRPRLPEALGDVTARLNLEEQSLECEIRRDAELTAISLNATGLRHDMQTTVELLTRRGRTVRTTFQLPARAKVRLELNGEHVTVTSSGKGAVSPTTTILSAEPITTMLDPLAFATPALRAGLKSMKAPNVPMLSRADVKANNPASRILADADDPEGDDVGTGHYTYPANPAFLPGIFDLRHATVRIDSVNAYFTLRFKALANPGWHPEYGFQLTFVAIAIDEDGIKGSGTQVIPRNSGFAVDSSLAFERIIYIGGGIEVADDRGTLLASYVPLSGDIADPLGDASTGTIRCAVPLKFLGTPSSRWRFTIIVGGQDDHGGAGLGEFRTVKGEREEWSGGGKINAGDPNVYDVLYFQSR